MQDDLTKKDLSEIYEKKTIEEKIRELAKTEMGKLAKKVNDRVIEMELDNDDHYLIYGVLGVDKAEGKMIDVYQNKGRFLYKYAGAFVEEAARLCFVEKFGEEKAKTVNIDNPIPNSSPKKFEIDCLINEQEAYEIKWRDATTDGDHINKENRRVKATIHHGYTPIRLMFFSPNRAQAIKIQNKLKYNYEENGGKFYAGPDAWNHIKEKTGVDLLAILEHIYRENTDRKEE